MREPLLSAPESVESLVGRVADEFLRRHEHGERPQVEEYVAQYPQAAALLRKVLTSLQLLEASAASGAPAPEQGADLVAGVLGDFRLVREIGRGGMGIVYEAEQVSLGRRVALKVLPFAGALDARQLQRFALEARAAALLHHQSIVPVYFVGCERGVHFYAMQLIEGQTLAQLIHQLRQENGLAPAEPDAPPAAEQPGRSGEPTTAHTPAPPPSAAAAAETAKVMPASRPTERSLHSREHCRMVARLGVQAAEALDHAHQRGIVHRDVKPGNLLLDGQGQLWVTDFGLAQFQSDTKLTLSGDLVGTLRYMSPEQALAQRVVVDHRTDVYSLGATLYELLALQPAYLGTDRQELLRQIAFEEPRALRKVNRAVPAELEVIVAKAMEKNPQERYATAQELADDLQRFLLDRPIQARRPTLGQRAVKWTRRHRLVVGSVLAALVVGMVATTWQAVRATHAEGEAWAALDKLEQEQGKTTAALAEVRRAGQQTLEALRSLTDEVLERHMAKQTQLTEEDRAFLRKVLQHYEGFAATKGDSREGRAIRAEGYLRVAGIRDRLGEHQDAQLAFERAIALLKQLAADFPDWPNYRHRLAGSYHDLGTLLEDLGKWAEAEAEYRQALALSQQLAVDFPTVPHYRKYLANHLNNLGDLLARRGKRAEAEAHCRKALVLFQQLAVDFPAVPDYRQNLAMSHSNLGVYLADQGKHAEAEAEYRQALMLSKQLAADFPTVANYRSSLARRHNNLANLLLDMGKHGAAEVGYRQALALRKQLAADFPALPSYRQDLAGSCHNLARLLAKLGKRVEAEAEYRQALALFGQLAADFPDVPAHWSNLAESHNQLGNVLRGLGKHWEAAAEYRHAVELGKRLAVDFPTVPKYRRDLAGSCHALGMLLTALEKLGEAAEVTYREALALWKQLAADFPTVPNYLSGLAGSHNNLANLLACLGKRAEAEGEHQQALALYKQLAANFPDVPDYQISLGGNYCNFGNLARDNGRPADALSWYDQAMAVLAPLVEREPRLVEARQFLRNSHEHRASALMMLDRFADAVRDCDRALALDDGSLRGEIRLLRAACLGGVDPSKAVAEAEAILQGEPPSPTLLYNACCVYARLAGRIRDAAATETYAARAVALLGQARQMGYFNNPANVAHMQKDADLDALRGRADFQQFLAELQASKK
jgi:serine/threonine protein kinase/Flp pilus assembly protein TadD